MKDIVADPAAVYGFSPDPASARLAAYADDPEGQAGVKKRHLETYGREEGPTPEELFEKYGSRTPPGAAQTRQKTAERRLFVRKMLPSHLNVPQRYLRGGRSLPL